MWTVRRKKAHSNISRYKKPIFLKNMFYEKDFTYLYWEYNSIIGQLMSNISIYGNDINITVTMNWFLISMTQIDIDWIEHVGIREDHISSKTDDSRYRIAKNKRTVPNNTHYITWGLSK